MKTWGCPLTIKAPTQCPSLYLEPTTTSQTTPWQSVVQTNNSETLYLGGFGTIGTATDLENTCKSMQGVLSLLDKRI
ncbi:hypothetical protein M408DRAFT_31316 [Serendipita vermifera MAFF 305830]|uniref:Uncharacterized protein n=1 Tax=Serendipita vermifera MAFF 305830 TaxID=933852 RepID=A0A0C3AJ35_SERVB|nr:hypothetical protein M408DRAFT_31316 [Serendipita vermifera MAFF 305830]